MEQRVPAHGACDAHPALEPGDRRGGSVEAPDARIPALSRVRPPTAVYEAPRAVVAPKRPWYPCRPAAALLLAALVTVGAASPLTAQGDRDSADANLRQAEEPTSQERSADAWRHVTFGVTLEAFYEFDGNRPTDRVIPLRAYDTRSNTFAIQQASFVLDAAPDVAIDRRYGMRVDLQFGMATEAVQGSAANEPRPDVYRHVWQAFGSYVLALGPRGLQLDAGKFASMLGYETNYAKDNQAFSRAFLFAFLPFYHTGLRLSFPVSDRLTLLYALTNGIQQTEDFNDFKSNHVAAIVRPMPAVVWTVNYYAGQEQPDRGAPGGPDGYFRVADTYVTVTPTPRLTLGADANHTTNAVRRGAAALSLQGLALYVRYQATTANGVGLRFERLNDQGLFGGVDQVLREVTWTVEHKLADGFLVRAELRRDWSSRTVFPGRSGASDVRRRQTTALVGGIWVIGNKSGTW